MPAKPVRIRLGNNVRTCWRVYMHETIFVIRTPPSIAPEQEHKRGSAGIRGFFAKMALSD